MTHSPQSPTIDTLLPYSNYLSGFKSVLNSAFHEQWDFNKQSYHRGIPPEVLKNIMNYKPLSTCISKEFGGRGDSAAQCMALMSEASYESLALSLMLSINYALFIQPVSKYGQEEAKKPIFKRFLENNHMGGLMITEPDFGSDALNMQTSYQEHSEYYHLTGKKHWAGLTGMANFWLLTGRAKTNGELQRDIDFFICDNDSDDQKVVVEEYFENLGLYLIPYGLNKIDVRIPKLQRLIPHTSGIKLMLDTLHRSRLQFPGMGMGFIKRILDEAIDHTQKRSVGGKSLATYDQVQQRLSQLQTNYTICSSLCVAGSEMANLKNDLTASGLEANIIKCVTTDLMQESSQSLLQLVGAKGYKLNHVAGRATVDSRPFQIFEGSNDILYIQICDAFIKKMTIGKENNLHNFASSFELSSLAASRLGEQLKFSITSPLTQRKQVEFGILASRIVTLNMVLRMHNRGFSPRLLESAAQTLIKDIDMQIYSYCNTSHAEWTESYEEKSFWLDFVKS